MFTLGAAKNYLIDQIYFKKSFNNYAEIIDKKPILPGKFGDDCSSIGLICSSAGLIPATISCGLLLSIKNDLLDV